jgi:hypothetical protein
MWVAGLSQLLRRFNGLLFLFFSRDLLIWWLSHLKSEVAHTLLKT